MSSIGPGDRHSVSVESYIQFADDELRANLNELTTQELSQLISNANQEMTKSRKRDFSDTPPSRGSDRVGAVMDIAKSVLIKKNESQITPEALEKKNGKVWDCVDAKIDPESGGVLYTFSFNQEKADKYSDLYRATFPPVESDGDEGTFEGFEMLSELNIGYSCDRSRKTITLPDSRYLSHQWKKLQEEQADLPDFMVCDSEGIASDDDFVEAMFTYDAVLSTEGEMVHDHSVHILPLVMQLRSQGEGYTNAKGLFRDLIREIWDEIKDVESLMDVSGESFVTYNGNEISRKELNQMKTLVGIAVDSANSFQFLNVVPSLIMEASSSKGSKLELLLRFPKQDPLWLRYMGDKYQDQHITIGDLETLAKKLSPSQNQHKRAVDQVHSKRYPSLGRTPDCDTFSGYSYSIKRNSVLKTCFKLINDHIQQLGFREDFNGDKPFFSQMPN